MMTENAITVYCASSADVDGAFFDAARELGSLIAGAGLTLVTGAGKTGLMGAVSDACVSAGGTAVGVIPQFMVDRGWHHPGLSRLIVTPDMHVRKQTMARMASAAVALPGGCGTLEELLEIITWRQLGLFGGNVVILNTLGYFDPLLEMLAKASAMNFMRPCGRRLWTVAGTPREALGAAMLRD